MVLIVTARAAATERGGLPCKCDRNKPNRNSRCKNFAKPILPTCPLEERVLVCCAVLLAAQLRRQCLSVPWPDCSCCPCCDTAVLFLRSGFWSSNSVAHICTHYDTLVFQRSGKRGVHGRGTRGKKTRSSGPGSRCEAVHILLLTQNRGGHGSPGGQIHCKLQCMRRLLGSKTLGKRSAHPESGQNLGGKHGVWSCSRIGQSMLAVPVNPKKTVGKAFGRCPGHLLGSPVVSPCFACRVRPNRRLFWWSLSSWSRCAVMVWGSTGTVVRSSTKAEEAAQFIKEDKEARRQELHPRIGFWADSRPQLISDLLDHRLPRTLALVLVDGSSILAGIGLIVPCTSLGSSTCASAGMRAQ